jgi:hypothetical protein
LVALDSGGRRFSISCARSPRRTRQVGSDGATWLDRELVSPNRTVLTNAGFGQEVTEAMEQRKSNITPYPQNDADAPNERSRYADMLSNYCFDAGIPLNFIPTTDSPKSRPPPSEYDRVPGTSYDYLGNYLPPDYANCDRPF